MKRGASVVIVMCFVLASSAYASIFNSSKQSVYVDSDPKGADVKSNKLPRAATTPTSFSFSKGGDISVTLSKDGYVDQAIVVNRSVTPSFWANFLWAWAFPIGMLVDAASGSMWNYDENVYAKLEPKKIPSESK